MCAVFVECHAKCIRTLMVYHLDGAMYATNICNIIPGGNANLLKATVSCMLYFVRYGLQL